MALGGAVNRMKTGKSKACYQRAKEGFVCLLGEDSAKAVGAAFRLARVSNDEKITKYGRLWDTTKVFLPDEAVTYDVASQLGVELMRKRQFEDAKVIYLAALEGRRRVLGEWHNKTLDSLVFMGVVLRRMKDYEGALDYYQQALRGRRRSWGRHILTP